jgi:hypothetical protein
MAFCDTRRVAKRAQKIDERFMETRARNRPSKASDRWLMEPAIFRCASLAACYVVPTDRRTEQQESAILGQPKALLI